MNILVFIVIPVLLPAAVMQVYECTLSVNGNYVVILLTVGIFQLVIY